MDTGQSKGVAIQLTLGGKVISWPARSIHVENVTCLALTSVLCSYVIFQSDALTRSDIYR